MFHKHMYFISNVDVGYVLTKVGTVSSPKGYASSVLLNVPVTTAGE